MTELATEHLFDISVEVAPPLDLRQADATGRLVVPVTGGRFDGPRLSGRIEPGAADWIVAGRGFARMNVNIVLRCDDGALIGMRYRGVNTIGDDIRQRIASGEDVPASAYYMRTAIFFETASEQYDWINRLAAVGLGRRTRTTVEYRVLALA